jgi:hypothetical protein
LRQRGGSGAGSPRCWWEKDRVPEAEVALAADDTAPPQISGRPQRVLRRALICVRHFRKELAELRETYAEREDLPGLRTLVDAMGALVAEAEREVIVKSRDYYGRIEEGEDAEAAEERFCDIVGGLVTSLEFALPNVLDLAREPHGREIEALILPFNDLLAKLGREDPRSVELIFEPGDDYAFEISVLDELREIAGKFTFALENQFGELPQLIAITYPKQREAETLGHAILAHEIGHTVLDYLPPGADTPPILDAFGSISSERFEEMREKIGEETGLSGEGLEIRADEADERMGRWFEEFACDALALGLVGPAYVFALADLDLATNRCAQIQGAVGFDSHPGLSWRLRNAISLAKEGYLAGREQGPATRQLIEGLDALEADLPSARDEITEAERALLESALSRLRETNAISRVLGDARYKLDDFREEVELVWEKIEDGIPPAERIAERVNKGAGRPQLQKVPKDWSEAIGWQSIVNGSYAYWLSERPMTDPGEKHRSFPDRPRLAQDWLDFNAFVRGSVELANLYLQLDSARDRLEALNEPRG